MDKELPRMFEEKLAEYKQMVIQRQEECVKIAHILEKENLRLSVKGRRYKNLLVVLGVVVTAKAALELAMLTLKASPVAMNALAVLFLVVGVAISMTAALDKTNRYEEKAGELGLLSGLCKSYDRRFMSDYKKFVDVDSPHITLARLESLIDLQNETLENIWQRSKGLGVDLSAVQISYRI